MNTKAIRVVTWREILVTTRTMRSALSVALALFIAFTVVGGVAFFANISSPPIFSFSFLYQFITGSVLSSALFFIPVIQVSNIFSREYEYRVHELLYLSPIDTPSLVVGKFLAAWIQVVLLYMPLVGVLIGAVWFYVGLSIDLVSMVLLVIAQLVALSSITMTVVLCSLFCRREMTSVVFSIIALYILMGVGNVESISYLSPFTFVSRFSTAVLDSNISAIDIVALILVCFYIILLAVAMVVLLDRRRAYIL